MLLGERVPFGGALKFDELPTRGHHDVHVGFAGRVLLVVQIGDRTAFLVEPYADRRQALFKRLVFEEAVGLELSNRKLQRHVGTGDGGCTCPTVSDDDVAVNHQGPLAELFKVNDGTQGAANQSLNFLSAARSPFPLSVATSVRRRREHGVLRREPPLIFTFEERRHTLLHVNRNLDFGISEFRQHTSMSVRINVRSEANGAGSIAFNKGHGNLVVMIRHLRLAQCDSTQDELKRQLDTYDLITTLQQTAGRGRGENVWDHYQGALAFSFQATAHPELTWQSLEVAVSLAMSLDVVLGVTVDLKWPNDLYRSNKKCGGILLNYHAPKMIVGVGLNLLQQPKNDWGFVLEAVPPLGEDWQHELPKQLVADYQKRHPMPKEEISQEWLKRCVHLGKTVTITDNGELTRGTFEGLGDYGEAIVSGRSIYNGTLRWAN